MRSSLGAAFLLALAVTGCSPAERSATPTSTPPTVATTTTGGSASSTSRPTVAPAVTRTLDLARYRTRPCDLVTAEQQAALNLPTQPAGEAFECEWQPKAPNKSVVLAVLVDVDYFAQVYRESNTDAYDGAGYRKWALFEPLEVSGQPAVAIGTSPDRFNCNIVVATGPKDSIAVTVIATDRTADSCPRATAIAEQVIRNLAG